MSGLNRLPWPSPRPHAVPERDRRTFVRPHLEELESRNLFAVSAGAIPAAPAFVFSAVPNNNTQAFQTTTSPTVSGQPTLVQVTLDQSQPAAVQFGNPTGQATNAPTQLPTLFILPNIELGLTNTFTPVALPLSNNSPASLSNPVQVQLLQQLLGTTGSSSYVVLNNLPTRATMNNLGGGGGVAPADQQNQPAPEQPSLPREEDFLKYTRMLSLAPTHRPARDATTEEVDRTFQSLYRTREARPQHLAMPVYDAVLATEIITDPSAEYGGAGDDSDGMDG